MKIHVKSLRDEIQNELKRAYNTYSSSTGKDISYSSDDLRNTTDRLQRIYRNAHKGSRGDLFVPFDKSTWKYITEKDGNYEIEYKWPVNGFTSDISYPETLKQGTVIDRLGNPYGRYACPYNGKAFSVSQRAIPYYCMESQVESEPSYHQYLVVKDITKSAILDELEKVSSSVYTEAAKKYIRNTLNAYDNWLTLGAVAAVSDFGIQGIGGGIQYYSVVRIQVLLDLNFIQPY